MVLGSGRSSDGINFDVAAMYIVCGCMEKEDRPVVESRSDLVLVVALVYCSY